MAKFDVIFANRFLAAYDAWKAGQQPTRAWRIAVSASKRNDLTVLQHLVLGMNAHINLDLGIAAARTAPGAALAGLRGDFDKINEVLASLLPVVESETKKLDPVLRWVTALAHGEQDVIANKFIDEARIGAFKFAQKLAALPIEKQSTAISIRDLEIAALGEGLVLAKPFARLLAQGESADVPRNIRILAKGERLTARRKVATAFVH
jgi:hypothetical protein